EWEQLPSSPTEQLNCVKRGLYFLTRQGRPLVIGIRPGSSIGLGEEPVLEVLARQRESAHEALADLLKEAERNNVYKGKAISLERPRSWRDEVVIHFHDLCPTARAAIVLPEDALRVIERNVLSLLKHGETLRRAGRSTRHGLLFHGP